MADNYLSNLSLKTSQGEGFSLPWRKRKKVLLKNPVNSAKMPARSEFGGAAIELTWTAKNAACFFVW